MSSWATVGLNGQYPHLRESKTHGILGRASLFSVFKALNLAALSDLRGLPQVILT